MKWYWILAIILTSLAIGYVARVYQEYKTTGDCGCSARKQYLKDLFS